MLQSKKLSKYDHLKHGFTEIQEGNLNLRKSPEAKETLSALVASPGSILVGFEQRHSKDIAVVDEIEDGKIVPNVDGGITNKRGIFLAVNTADCVPLLFFDPQKQIVAAVHAGWRGILAGIVDETITIFQKFSSIPEDIIVAIGPHINVCCYDIEEKRANQFTETFGAFPDLLVLLNGRHYLNLSAAIKVSLLKKGVRGDHIEYFLGCTSCKHDRFYSYRRSKSTDYGEMTAFIGLEYVTK